MSALVQGSNEWLELRKTKIGASDAPIIMGVSPWKTPYQLYQEKMSIGLPEVTKGSERMQRGHDLEPIARELFTIKTGIIIQPDVMFHPEFDWMIASLDGINCFKTKLVEIKCPGEKDHAIAAAGKIPEKYFPQLQHQLEVTGLDMLYYFSFDGVDGVIVEVKRDQKYIDKLLKKESDFYECMINRTPPDLTDRDFTHRDDLPWNLAASNWKDVTDQIKQLEVLEKRMRDTLIKESGNSNCYGAGVRLTKVVRKGAVDYTSIPDIAHIDVEKYRKDPIESWRIGAI